MQKIQVQGTADNDKIDDVPFILMVLGKCKNGAAEQSAARRVGSEAEARQQKLVPASAHSLC